jgi:hypothetical protein
VITVTLDGAFPPRLADVKGKVTDDIRKHVEKEKRRWKKEDPIWALRQCLSNKLRSQHWRAAHSAKKHFLDIAQKAASVQGDSVAAPACVIITMAIPGKCDTDAPVKALLDAFQHILFKTKDDSAAGPVFLVPHEPARGDSGPEPFVRIDAISINDEIARVHEHIGIAVRSYYQATSPYFQAGPTTPSTGIP